MLIGFLLPFAGTSLGSLMVFAMKTSTHERMQQLLTGFAAGIMAAASVWSLLIPAIEQSERMGRWSFVPALCGIWGGILFLWILDRTIPHLEPNSGEREGPDAEWKKTTMLLLAVTLHNIPEGMAVGVVYAGLIGGTVGITAAGAATLSLGIAIQNFPEGAIISMPLCAAGMKKRGAAWCGILSGVVEPIAAAVTVCAAKRIGLWMPYLLSLAAGAMLYVVVEELMPELYSQPKSKTGILAMALGFSLMLLLDVALG